jgi:SAM-dependent methyltransferase
MPDVNTSSEINLDLVATQWGKAPPEFSRTFYGFPPLRDYLYFCISGKTAKTESDWCEKWTIDTFLKDKLPVGECLSLCSGFGHLERVLAKHGVFRHATGLDISAGAVKAAKDLALKEGYTNIDYAVQNINQLQLQENQYDVIWANGAIHHLTGLEHVIPEIKKALKPGGLFVCNEYVGPAYKKIPPRQRELVNAVIYLLPPRLKARTEETFIPLRWEPTEKSKNHFKVLSKFSRKFLSNPEFHFGQVWDEGSAYTKRMDPSECVRSDEIIPQIQAVFEKTQIFPYNGSILFYALDHVFYKNFDFENRADFGLLETLIQLERHYISSGELTSDHAHIVCQK